MKQKNLLTSYITSFMMYRSFHPLERELKILGNDKLF